VTIVVSSAMPNRNPIAARVSAIRLQKKCPIPDKMFEIDGEWQLYKASYSLLMVLKFRGDVSKFTRQELDICSL
jgi:hypothetical protein